MNPRSTSVPMSSTRTRSPTSRPSNPRISFPSSGGWNRRTQVLFSEAPATMASNRCPRGHQGDPGISDAKCGEEGTQVLKQLDTVVLFKEATNVEITLKCFRTYVISILIFYPFLSGMGIVITKVVSLNAWSFCTFMSPL